MRPDPRRRALDGLTFALFSVALGTNVPTPLLLVYRDRLGLSESDLTAIFGSYAIGLVAALAVAGPASDRFGRRRLVLPFTVLAGVASVLFVPAVDSVALLYVARVLQGAVSGVVFSVTNAWLQDLSGPQHQRGAAVRGAVSTSLGFALAPVMSGVLAQYGPWPTTLPYLVHLAVLAAGLTFLVRVPETVREPRKGPLLRLGLPRPGRRDFWAVLAPAAVCVYAFPSVAVTLLPLLVDGGGLGVAYAGVVAGSALGASAVAAGAARVFGPLAAPLGAATGAIGFALGAVAVATQAGPLLVPVGLLLGGGAGLCLTAGLTLTAQLAPAHARGAMNSAFYALAYAGFGAPLLLSVLASFLGPLVPLAGIAVLSAGTAAWLYADLRRRGALTR